MRAHYFEQERAYTCGPASARMVLASFGVQRKEYHVARVLGTKKLGTSDDDFIKLAKKYKLQYLYKNTSTLRHLKQLQKDGYKIIVSYWYSPEKIGHYAVLKKIGSKYVHLLDPWVGPKHKYRHSYFQKIWNWSLCAEPDSNRCWFFAVRK